MSAESRPYSRTSPSVGAVISDRTLSSVLLPAPFGPMMPTASPRLRLKLTSCSAQKGSYDGHTRDHVRPSQLCEASPAVLGSQYRFDTCATSSSTIVFRSHPPPSRRRT